VGEDKGKPPLRKKNANMPGEETKMISKEARFLLLRDGGGKKRVENRGKNQTNCCVGGAVVVKPQGGERVFFHHLKGRPKNGGF